MAPSFFLANGLFQKGGWLEVLGRILQDIGTLQYGSVLVLEISL